MQLNLYCMETGRICGAQAVNRGQYSFIGGWHWLLRVVVFGGAEIVGGGFVTFVASSVVDHDGDERWWMCLVDME